MKEKFKKENEKEEPVVKESKWKKQDGGKCHGISDHNIFVNSIFCCKFNYNKATTLC